MDGSVPSPDAGAAGLITGGGYSPGDPAPSGTAHVFRLGRGGWCPSRFFGWLPEGIKSTDTQFDAGAFIRKAFVHFAVRDALAACPADHAVVLLDRRSSLACRALACLTSNGGTATLRDWPVAVASGPRSALSWISDEPVPAGMVLFVTVAADGTVTALAVVPPGPDVD